MHPVNTLKKYLNAGAFSQIAVTMFAMVTTSVDKWYGVMTASPLIMKMIQVVQPMYGVPVDPGIIVKYGPPPVVTPTPVVMPVQPSTFPVTPDNFLNNFMPVITPSAQPSYLDPGSHVMPLFNNWWNIFSGNNGFGITTPEGMSSLLGLTASFVLPLWAMLGWVFWGSVWYYKTKDKK